MNPGRNTVENQLAHWLGRQRVTTRGPSTIPSYQWAIDNHLVPVLGSNSLSKLTPEDVDQLLSMAKSGAAKNTLMRVRAVLSMALDGAVAKGRSRGTQRR